MTLSALAAILASMIPAGNIGFLQTAQEHPLLPEPTRANVQYKESNNRRTVLDFYQAAEAGARPTVIFLHGGGWRGSKAGRDKMLMPFLTHGWNVVNVEYRVPPRDRAPASLVDARCAIHWVRMHAKELRVDPSKIIISGSSAGGQLALMASLPDLPEAFRCERNDHSTQSPVAGVVVWWGVVDLKGVITKTPPLRSARTWIGNRPDFDQMVTKLSPTENITKGIPPIILVQGELDPVAPLSHTIEFDRKLNATSVPSKLIIVPRGRHGRFSVERMKVIFKDVFDFFKARGIG
nr:alpha/beta hydrolase [uncultured Sphingomonas sp.]